MRKSKSLLELVFVFEDQFDCSNLGLKKIILIFMQSPKKILPHEYDRFENTRMKFYFGLCRKINCILLCRVSIFSSHIFRRNRHVQSVSGFSTGRHS